MVLLYTDDIAIIILQTLTISTHVDVVFGRIWCIHKYTIITKEH